MMGMQSTGLPTMRWALSFAICVCACASRAQVPSDSPNQWVEETVGAAPTFATATLIPIEMPAYVSVKVGVDPDTVTVGSDGIVRYVVVMTNATGSVNAAFEGIRCATDEVKVYARQGSSGKWTTVAVQQWKSVNDHTPSRHAYAIARQGACNARSTPTKTEVLLGLRRK
jgi:hypothetical protein